MKRIMVLALAGVALVAALAAPEPGSAQEVIGCPDFQVEVAAAQQPVCEITVTKTLTSGNPVRVGDLVTYEVVVENTGNFPFEDVNLTDSYDQTNLSFVSASVAPTSTDSGVGILNWDGLLPDPDGGMTGWWDGGESLTLTVTFRATATTSADNCAVAVATLIEFESGISSEVSCASVRIDPKPHRRQPTATPTQRPNTPTPVSTVQAATAVPSTATPRTGIVAPSTGTGNSAGGGGGTLAIVVIASLAMSAGGLALLRAGRRC
jgi:uncharacterized repeat protein (TIGR01451 family)